MKKNTFWMIIVLTLAPGLCRAGGLSTSFADVQVGNVRVGKAYNLTRETGKRMDFQNTGDQPISVTVQALVPPVGQLRGNAESIPDLNWIKIKPAQVTIPPQGKGYLDVTIMIPAGTDYHGRTFQVALWARSAPVNPTPGVTMNAALLSRLRFTTLP